MKIGVLGLGYWGPNLVRNFMIQKEVDDVYAFDINKKRISNIIAKFPTVKTCSDFNDMLNSVDAVVIATPVDLHYQYAKESLLSGKHIWVEKPFTSDSRQAAELMEIAEKKGLKIFVDHTFIYTGSVKKIKTLTEKNELGDILYIDSVRINLGLFQHDVNVIWDLAPHDFSISNYIMGDRKVVAVSAHGVAHYNNHENIAHIAVYYEGNSYAHFHVNWISPVKIRRMIFGGTKKMLVFDDMENFEKIKVYDSGIEMTNQEKIREALVQYRIGDMYSPKVDQVEALNLGAMEFINSINENRQPLTSGEDGLKVVRILEAAENSIKNRGKIIEIK